jgi:hypothetical protein
MADNCEKLMNTRPRYRPVFNALCKQANRLFGYFVPLAVATMGVDQDICCGCFALVVPWLGTLGWKVSSQLDPKTPPTVQQTINTHASINSGILVFCIGFASLLWSYSPSISGLFILGCVVAVRRVVSYSKKIVATTLPPASSIIRLP